MCDDHWVKVAMADDSLVVDLLLSLHRSPPPPPCLNLHWTVRQRRSRSAHNKAESTRASPTTPLSWSGATSASGGNLDGYEESKPSQTSRSKPVPVHVVWCGLGDSCWYSRGVDSPPGVANPSETATTRKTRRKKTLTELKEEEDLLLKERRNLEKELASLRLTIQKHRATNESIKRLKLDFESRQNSSAAATASEVSGKAVNGPFQFVKSECHPSNSVTHDDSPVCAANASPKAQDNIGNRESTFVLPDLNLPADEDINANVMH
ncbi:hypothetical protein HKD37_13G038747 [Glycine soja]